MFELERTLTSAIIKNQDSAVAPLIEEARQQFDSETFQKIGLTALHQAIDQRKLPLVQLLLTAGIQPNILSVYRANQSQRSAIMQAIVPAAKLDQNELNSLLGTMALIGNFLACQLLLARGAQVTNSILRNAINSRDLATVQLILAQLGLGLGLGLGLRPSPEDCEMAIETKNLQLIQLVLSAWTEPLPSRFLMKAIATQNLAVVQWLLNQGLQSPAWLIKPNKTVRGIRLQSSHSLTPALKELIANNSALWRAVKCNDITAVNQLLSTGIEPNTAMLEATDNEEIQDLLANKLLELSWQHDGTKAAR